ncbi:unnamed protein product [Mucor hiemalis]
MVSNFPSLSLSLEAKLFLFWFWNGLLEWSRTFPLYLSLFPSLSLEAKLSTTTRPLSSVTVTFWKRIEHDYIIKDDVKQINPTTQKKIFFLLLFTFIPLHITTFH